MVVVCLGGVCVPIHLLLAFLVALAHKHGYLLWLREEWFKFTYWRQKFKRKEEVCRHEEKDGSNKDE